MRIGIDLGGTSVKAALCEEDGALLCKQGPALFCPPARDRARDSVCLDFLLERSLVQERLCGLAKALSSQELFRANSLHGLEKLVVVKD